MKIFRKIAVRVIPVAALAFIITAAITYQRGVYDITFIERPSTDTSENSAEVESSDSEAPTTTEPVQTVETTETTAPPPETTLPVKTDPVSEFLSTLPNRAELPTWYVTDEVYRPGMQLAITAPSITLPRDFSKRLRDEIVYNRVPSELYGGYSTEESTISVERPLIEVYMDYTLVDDGSYVDILDRDGNLLADNIDIEYYVPAYTRDQSDIPQFKVATGMSGGEINYKYYRLENGGFVESDYDDFADNRGLYFNYPSYYGKSDSDVVRFSRNGGYGYARENGNAITTARYTEAFNFSEGLAAVVVAETARPDKLMLSYINTRYYNELYCMKGYWNGWYYNEVEQRVAANYRLPDTRGEESIGFFYFENGLCRVRKQEHNYYHTYQTQQSDRLMTDEDLVIRSDGTVYEIPGGYTVKSYSSGIFVLEKDRRYGAMDYTGDFIVAPDYDIVEPFYEGLGVVAKDGKFGVIDTEGNFVVPMIFDYIQSCSSGVIAAWDSVNGWTLLSKLA